MISEAVIVSLLTVSACLAAPSASELASMKDHNELKDSAFEKTEMVMVNVDKYCKIMHDKSDEEAANLKAQSVVRDSLLSIMHDCEDPSPDDKEEGKNTTAPDQGSHDSDPCTSIDTQTLTGEWRKDNHGSDIRPNNGLYACDSDLQRGTTWFRFSECAGGQLSNVCAPGYSCGSHGGFWTNAHMPTYTGQVLQLPMYGSWNGDCTWYRWPTMYPLTVKRCSSRHGDLVYKVQGASACNWAFCGMPT